MPALKTVSRSLLLASCAMALIACATKPDLGPKPELAVAKDFRAAETFAGADAEWPSDRWWERYGDNELSALIDEALEGSPNLEAASARLRRAEAEAQQAGAALKPTLGAEGGFEATRRDVSSSALAAPAFDAFPIGWSGQFKAGLSLRYQLDFFGRNKAALAAAQSREEAAAAEAASARLQISTAVALAYAELARLGAERKAADAAADLRARSAALVKDRVAAGLGNRGDAEQAESEFASARADLIAIDAAIGRVRHRIAALLGKGPDRGLEIAIPEHGPVVAMSLPATIELELMARRPDIVAARRLAEGAASRIKVAKADFYPNINLVASAGLQAFTFGQLSGDNLGFAQAGPSTTLPIFSGGRIEGAYRAARADYDEAVATYNQALADAYREVADAILDLKAQSAQLDETRAALKSQEAAYAVARQRYEGGLASYIDTLTVESALIAARRAAATLEARTLALDIALIRALGGGFNETKA